MGKRGPRAITGKEKQPTDGKILQPLRGMSLKAKQMWKMIVNDFCPGFYTDRHYPLLLIFCESWARHEQASSQLKKEDLVVKNMMSGATKKNPLLQILDAEFSKMIQISTRLSLVIDPKAPGSQPETISKRADLLFGGREKVEPAEVTPPKAVAKPQTRAEPNSLML